MGWNDLPIKVKYSKEHTAVLHQYTRGDSKNPGNITVIHVRHPDFRERPGTTCAEVANELAQAYKIVFKIFNETGLQSLRIQPISCGTLAGCFQDIHQILTVAAVQIAYSHLPKETQTALRTTDIELCIYYERDHRNYCDAFKNFTAKTLDKQIQAAQEQHRHQQHQQPRRFQKPQHQRQQQQQLRQPPHQQQQH